MGNKETSPVNVCMIQNCATLFYCNTCLTFRLSTVCGTLNESVSCNSIIELDQSRNEISLNTHTQHFKTQEFVKRSYLVLNEEERKQERKANGIITLDGGNNKKVELSLKTKKLHTNKVTVETTKRL